MAGHFAPYRPVQFLGSISEYLYLKSNNLLNQKIRNADKVVSNMMQP
jgi:hypothetical protein